MRADLHIHSENSFDGCDSVENIIKQAKLAKIDVIAITDHNAVLLKNYSDSEIKVINGIEIDCYFGNKIIHLLGYGIDTTDIRYQKLHDNYYQELASIAIKRLRLIEKHFGCQLDLDKIKSLSSHDYFTNVEITKVLLSDIKHPDLEVYQTGKKANNPIANFYWDNLAIGKWGYTAMTLPTYQKIISLIHETKGVCICAHPFVNIGCDQAAINQLVAAGIDGFEAYCSYHNEETSAFYQTICEQKQLLYTCGSDYHGPTKPNIKLYDHHFKGDCNKMMKNLFMQMKHFSTK